tara:strand:+ start:314 stop:493 length:180 start_codon:yes stop_codon:yes gene_type:complete
MIREKEWDFMDEELKQIEDDKSLLAVIGLMALELSKMHPNDALLGKEVRELIKKYNVEK